MDVSTTPAHSCQVVAKVMIIICFFLNYLESESDGLIIDITFVGREKFKYGDQHKSKYLGGQCNGVSWCQAIVADPYVYSLVLIISMIAMGFRRQALFDPSKLQISRFGTAVCAFLCFLMPSIVLGLNGGAEGMVIATLLLQYFAGALYVIVIILDCKIQSRLGNIN